jgi:hypothetical protein
MDIAAATAAASESATPEPSAVLSGFDGGTFLSSPVDGFHAGQSAVLRAVAHNGYRAGASGVAIFNYDAPHHRGQKPEFAAHTGSPYAAAYHPEHMELLTELGREHTLAQSTRQFCAVAAGYGEGSIGTAPGDPQRQLPRKLAMRARGAGRHHAVAFHVADDLNVAVREGRVASVELRLLGVSLGKLANHGPIL